MKQSVYKSFVILAIPIIIQQFFSQALVFIDQSMLGHLGKEVIAALGAASQLSFFYYIAQFGILSAGSLFIAQYHGKGEHQMVRRIFGFMTIVGFIFSVIFAIGYYFGSDFIFQKLYNQSPRTVEIGSKFLKIIAISFIMSTMSASFSTAMRSIEKIKEPMIASTISIVINICLNLLFIPKYGALGAAYGTFIARFIEMLFLMIVFKISKNPFNGGKIKDYWITNRVLLKQIYKISLPVFLTEVLWALATLIIALLYTQTHDGVDGGAASSIAELVISLQSILFMGVSSATAIMVGKAIGENGREDAIFIAKKLTKLAFFVTTALVVFSYFIGIPLIMRNYHFETETAKYLTYLSLLVVTFMSFFKLINWFMFIGIFRAGGDTKFALYADIGFLYFYAIPAVLIGLYMLNLPVHMLIFLAMFEEFLKVIVGIRRYLSGKWIHDVTRDVYHV